MQNSGATLPVFQGLAIHNTKILNQCIVRCPSLKFELVPHSEVF